MIVVDASLAAKWIFEETDSDAAAYFLVANGGGLHAPDLLFPEVAGAIVKRMILYPRAEADASATLRQWADACREIVELHPITPRLLQYAGEMAIGIGHAVQDCIYLALAMEHSAGLATCDRKFRDKARGFYPDIRLLSDYV